MDEKRAKANESTTGETLPGLFSDAPAWLLVSDLDGTLDGDAESLEGLAGLTGPAGPIRLVLNSSRPRASVLGTLATLPVRLRPRGMITALGTEIWLEGREDREWPELFRSWDRGPVDALMDDFGAVPHPAGMQTRFKASFAVPRRLWPEVEVAVRGQCPGSQVITSGESDFDVIPTGAGKGEATLRVADRLGLPRERLVVAGDSANDLSLFAVSRRCVAVGNARSELLDRADPERTYRARAPRAAGVIEGLRHWGALRCHHRAHV